MIDLARSKATTRRAAAASTLRIGLAVSVASLAIISIRLNASADDRNAPKTQSSSSQPDLNDPDKHQQFVLNMLRHEKWEDLDAFVSRERTSKSRFPGGGWGLHSTYIALADPPTPEGNNATDAEWQAHAGRLLRWTIAKPDSITARVALAKFYLDYAWFARGPEYADLVSDDSMKVFDERLEKARDVLAAAFKLPSKCPEWYLLMMELARAQGWPLEEQKHVLETAMVFEPLYYYYYQDYAFTLQPRWYGQVGDSEKFADEVATRIGGKQGAMVYFEIAAFLSCDVCPYGKSQFKQMSWERIQRGYAAEVEMYGQSSAKLNEFTRLAMLAEDRKLAAALFSQIGDNWCKCAWHSKHNFLIQRRFAWGVPDEIVQAWTASFKGFEKPGGLAYAQQINSDFHNHLDAAVKSCAATFNHDAWSFTVFLKIGSNGRIEEALPWPPTRVSSCLLPGLTTRIFAVPPEPSFWTYINVGDVKAEPFIYEGDIPDVGK